MNRSSEHLVAILLLGNLLLTVVRETLAVIVLFGSTRPKTHREALLHKILVELAQNLVVEHIIQRINWTSIVSRKTW